jgi:hypothetical protein
MRNYIRLVPDTGFRIVWRELKPGAPAVNQRDMPMTRAEWLRFAYMLRNGLRREQVGNVVYLIEHRTAEAR